MDRVDSATVIGPTPAAMGTAPISVMSSAFQFPAAGWCESLHVIVLSVPLSVALGDRSSATKIYISMFSQSAPAN